MTRERHHTANPSWSPQPKLDELASKVERLSPSHRDPFAFHEEKSEIVHQLRSLAAGMGRKG